MGEINTRITFKQVNETEVDVLEDGKIVGNIWSCKQSKDDYPYIEHKGYEADSDNKREEVQICGFNAMSVVWDCGIFEKKKDLVVTFNESAKQDPFNREMFFHELREWCKENSKHMDRINEKLHTELVVPVDDLIKFANIKLSKVKEYG